MMGHYKFRAECLDDVLELLRLIGADVHEWRLFKHGEWPDVVVELKVQMTLMMLIGVMREVVDGHVMVETVAPIDKYTGERR